MDATAIAMCQENKLPIVVFDLNQHGNIQARGDGREGWFAGVPGSGLRQL